MGHLEDYDEDMAEWEEQEWDEYKRNQIVGRNVSIFFTVVALLKGAYHRNILFRYTDIDGYWDNSEVGNKTNWWKLGNQIMHWAGFVGFSTMALSQLISLIFGLGKMNYIIWGWGLTLFALATFVYNVMAGMGYENAYRVIVPRDGAANTPTDIVKAKSLQNEITQAILVTYMAELTTNIVIAAGALPWRRYQVGYSWREDDSDYDESEWEEEKRRKRNQRRVDRYGKKDKKEGDKKDKKGKKEENEEDWEDDEDWSEPEEAEMSEDVEASEKDEKKADDAGDAGDDEFDFDFD